MSGIRQTVVVAILAIAGLCIAGCGHSAKPRLEVPYVASAGEPPPIGSVALDFTLLDQDGRPVHLAEVAAAHRSVAVIFYRGFW